MSKKSKLTARNFPTVQQVADAVGPKPLPRYEGPDSSYKLAFQDMDFLPVSYTHLTLPTIYSV